MNKNQKPTRRRGARIAAKIELVKAHVQRSGEKLPAPAREAYNRAIAKGERALGIIRQGETEKP